MGEILYHRDEDAYCKKIALNLKQCGIKTDMITGQINYLPKFDMKLRCNALYLLRHGETEASVTNRFMGRNSLNSKLIDEAKYTLKETAEEINKLQFDVVLYSDIPRVKETTEIIKKYVTDDTYFVEIPWMLGIDNTGWEGKTKDELQGMDIEDFYQREIVHNIFAKSSKGTSWGTVLDCCLKFVLYINKYFADKKILLVSQGSVFTGLQIVLHLLESPWEKYDAYKLFSLTEGSRQLQYGRLQLLYESIKNS